MYKFGLLSTPAVYLFMNKYQATCDDGSVSSSQPGPNKEPVGPVKSEAEQGAEELEKILKENPFAATDPEEMERLLKAQQKNKDVKPPQFSRLMVPIKMMTHCEALDGLRFDINGAISEKLQLGGSWNFSNTKPSNFSLNAMFSPNMSPFSADGMNFINVKRDVLGKMEFMGNY